MRVICEPCVRLGDPDDPEWRPASCWCDRLPDVSEHALHYGHLEAVVSTMVADGRRIPVVRRRGVCGHEVQVHRWTPPGMGVCFTCRPWGVDVELLGTGCDACHVELGGPRDTPELCSTCAAALRRGQP